MKVTHNNIIIEIDSDERLMLKGILSIVEELGNDAVRNEKLSGTFIRAGLDEPREAGLLGKFASDLNEQL